MKKIYKYPLEITDRQTVHLGKNDKPLSVQFQRGDLCMWVLCDIYEEKTLRCFVIHGTGNPIEGEVGEYIGTAQQPVNGLVWHIFEVSHA